MEMKLLLTLLFIFPLTTFAFEEDCDYPASVPVLETGNAKMIKELHDGIKSDFKKRPMNLKGYNLALSIETNFEAPIIGKDKYWGRIYLHDSDTKNIKYRDDLIAEEHYNKEKKNPGSFNYSNYSVADINSAKGLSLVKAAGAEVNVKSSDGKFTTKNGGRLVVKVKAPNEKAFNLTMDVNRQGARVNKTLILGNKRVPFDSFKINASKNFLGVTTILSGITNIQFYSGGKVVHTITQ